MGIPGAERCCFCSRRGAEELVSFVDEWLRNRWRKSNVANWRVVEHLVGAVNSGKRPSTHQPGEFRSRECTSIYGGRAVEVPRKLPRMGVPEQRDRHELRPGCRDGPLHVR